MNTTTRKGRRPSSKFPGVYARGTRLYVRFKAIDVNGKSGWTQARTKFFVGQEAQAATLLEAIKRQTEARASWAGADEGPLTLKLYTQRWLKQRETMVGDIQNDRARLNQHVLPFLLPDGRRLGDLGLEEVRPRHLIALFTYLRAQPTATRRKVLAPKTIYNVYGLLKALYRDAVTDELVTQSPCILTAQHLGPNVDKDPEWRATAVFARNELEMLISDDRIPFDRQVAYALEGVAGLRHGEVAALRWRHYDPTVQPLGRLTIARSNKRERTKTSKTRWVPIHPTLAAMLAEWKLTGWPRMMGRQPAPDDLVLPLPPAHIARRRSRNDVEGMRGKDYSGKRLREEDLPKLNLRHRRGHDLRRTFISVALDDGADRYRLERVTHNPKKTGTAFDDYVSLDWSSLCAEVAKLKVYRRQRGQVVSLPRAVVAGGHPTEAVLTQDEAPQGTDLSDEEATRVASSFASADGIPSADQQVVQWRRRESNHSSTLSRNPSGTPVSSLVPRPCASVVVPSWSV